jgi:tetratricopeptide (TPR) repeat protein
VLKFFYVQHNILLKSVVDNFLKKWHDLFLAMSKKKFIFLLFLFSLSCYRVPDRIDPRVNYQLQELHFQHLHSAFPPLTLEERRSDWGREYIIARTFADRLDLYRAVSTFKRAEILLPPHDHARKLEVQYDILLCFFLGKKYDEAIEAFESSGLAHVDQSFPAYSDLLLVLYECYRETDNQEKQERILELMNKTYPEMAEKLKLSRAIREGDLAQVTTFASGFHESCYLDDFLNTYWRCKKSVGTAQGLNALLPGAGYLYIGQKKSALTAMILNGLFIAAAYEFFHHGHIAAGVITSSFEAGWYFGGIYGAGEEAKYYNERLYERSATQVLNEHKLFPVLMMGHAF